jgi:5'-deoxynucleotidase YfbR-like HD superfamily hydrolase
MQEYTTEEKIRRISNVLESGEVQRFHAVPSVPAQSVAQHAWGVAVLVTFVKKDPRPDLIIHALSHDMAELYTGDIPFTTKREVPGMNELLDVAERTYCQNELFDLPRITKAEKLALKLCDMLEGLRWTKLNERNGFNVHTRWARAIQTLLLDPLTATLLDSEEIERAYKLYDEFRYVN